MNTKVLVAFALKDEFTPWRRRHRFHSIAPSVFEATMGAAQVCVALAGAGAPDAGRVQNLTAQFAPTLGIVTGVAAGLKPEWRTGDLLVAEAVSSPRGGEKILCDPNLLALAVQCGAKRAATLVTLPHIARTLEEKVRLSGFGEAADMESLPLVKHWSSCGIPALALRVILDPVEMPMTCDFEAAMDAHGQVRITAILAQLARRPQLLPDFLRLARQSRRDLRILADFLDRFVENLAR